MKVGVIGSVWLNTPPKGYGGTELVIYNLVNGLVDKGHDVTLFGPKTAEVKAKVFPTVEKPLREQNVAWTNVTYPLLHITEAFDKAASFDVLHVHVNKSQDYIALPLALSCQTPVVFTLHFKVPTPSYNQDRYKIFNKYRFLPFISISDSQRDGLDVNFISTAYNGLDLKIFPFVDNPGDYFVWLGKVNPVKGTKEAILAAKKAGVKLYVVGAVDSGVPSMLTYYENEVKPLIDGKQIIWIGEVTIQEKVRILGGARAMLNPILWEEPFGLVMTEAQATGTPVISFKMGAAEELIVEGKTGFLVKNIEEMVERIKQVDALKRSDCRKNVEERFSIEKMVEAYENAYKTAIGSWKEYMEKQKAIL